MMKRCLLVLIFFFLIYILPAKTFAQNLSLNSEKNAEKRIILRYKNKITETNRLKFHRNLKLIPVSRIDTLNSEILTIKNDSFIKTLEKIKLNPDVLYVENDALAKVSEMTNDPALINYQHNLFQIGVAGSILSGWNYSKGDGVTVAVIDTGIDSSHYDLKNKIDGEYNCTDSQTEDDLYGHGTHVAGIIAGETNNQNGIAGIGYNARLINAKALGDNGMGYYSWIANCIIWSVENGAKVINLSLGGNSYSKTLEDAVDYAFSKGAVVIAAAGNSGKNTPEYPAGFRNVIAVGAVDNNDNKAYFSNYGRWVAVVAPGISIYSTLPNHPNKIGKTSYGTLSGTSMATPHVSGLAALLYGIDRIAKDDVIKYLEIYSERIPGSALYSTYGRINAFASLQAAKERFDPLQDINESNISPIPVYSPSPSPSPTSMPSPTPLYVIITPTPDVTVFPTPSPYDHWERICSRYPQFCRK